MDEPDIFTMESHEIWPGPRSQTSLADLLGHSQMSSKQILGGAGQVLALLPWTNSSVTIDSRENISSHQRVHIACKPLTSAASFSKTNLSYEEILATSFR